MQQVTRRGIITVGVLLPCLASTAVALRFYCRKLRNGFAIDDWLILFALLTCVGLGVMMIVGGAAHDLAVPTPTGDGPEGFLTAVSPELIASQKMRFVMNLCSTVAFGAIKASVLMFYRRIFRGTTFNIVSWACLTVVILWTLAFFFAIIFQCGLNVWANWYNALALITYCPAGVALQEWLCYTDLCTDFIILSIPAPMVWRLQMPTRRKLAVIGVFMFGAVALAASSLRLASYYEQVNDAFSKPQGILLLSSLIYWCQVELGISIMAACLPTLQPLFGEVSLQTVISKFQSVLRLQSGNASNEHGWNGKFGQTKNDDTQVNFPLRDVYNAESFSSRGDSGSQGPNTLMKTTPIVVRTDISVEHEDEALQMV